MNETIFRGLLFGIALFACGMVGYIIGMHSVMRQLHSLKLPGEASIETTRYQPRTLSDGRVKKFGLEDTPTARKPSVRWLKEGQTHA